jgi:catechol 2,3-dioxygenase-like lactoylglutathione lyase family enzyme
MVSMSNWTGRLREISLGVDDPITAAAYYAELLDGYQAGSDVKLGDHTQISLRKGPKGLSSVGIDLLSEAAARLQTNVDSYTADADGNRLQIHACEDIEELSIPTRPTLGHLTLQSPDPLSQQYFYEQAGFELSEALGDFFRWLRCNPVHHALAFSRGSKAGLHHIGIELPDRAALIAACDRLAELGQPIEYGPGRHRVGGNLFVYFVDRHGFRFEFFCELDRIEASTFVAPVHGADDRQQTVNIWGPLPPDSFRQVS